MTLSSRKASNELSRRRLGGEQGVDLIREEFENAQAFGRRLDVLACVVSLRSSRIVSQRARFSGGIAPLAISHSTRLL
jgi:hypothetical protein